MDLMLDTCGLLSLVGLVEKRLSDDTLSRIAGADTVYVSACSLFEIAIKHKKKGLDLGVFHDAAHLWDKALAEYELTELPITGHAFFQSVALPDVHADPFDRIIAAQTVSLDLSLITFDTLFVHYRIPVMS